jgi:hypothetical protein
MRGLEQEGKIEPVSNSKVLDGNNSMQLATDFLLYLKAEYQEL